MKKILLMVFFAILCLPSQAQSVINVGLRDNENIFVSYVDRRHWLIALENSVRIDKLQAQSCRLYLGLDKMRLCNGLDNSLLCWAGTSWGGTFFAFDAMDCLRYSPSRFFTIQGSLGYHYDSLLRSSFLWAGGVTWNAFREVSFFAEATNRVTYREAAPYCYIGVEFHTARLRVAPALALPLKDDIKHSRFRISLQYTIPLRKATPKPFLPPCSSPL